MSRRPAANPRHSHASTRWGTTPEYVAMARKALGGRIELDPMSEPRFNAIVRSQRIYTAKQNGLAQAWRCKTMLINPDGDVVSEAWDRLTFEHTRGYVKRAVWIGFSVEQLNVLADEPYHPTDFSLLLVRKRIDFLTTRLRPGGRPSHGNYVVGLGIKRDVFERAFAGRGRFSHGALAL